MTKATTERPGCRAITAETAEAAIRALADKPAPDAARKGG